MSNGMLAPRNDLVGWRWVLYDYIKNDIIRDEAGSGYEFDTRDDAMRKLQELPQYETFYPQKILPGNKVPDIFSAKLQIPGTVVIAGAGPSLQEGLDRVDESEYVIALNSAINYNFPYKRWIAFDHRIVDYPWWPTLKLPKGCKTLFGSRLCNRLAMTPADAKHKPDHYFNYLPQIDRDSKPGQYLMDGYLRGGMNVLGAALQFAYWQGANRVLLTGCDQFGVEHWNGWDNPDPYGGHRAHWICIERLTHLVKEMAAGGVTVESLTDTAIAGVTRV